MYLGSVSAGKIAARENSTAAKWNFNMMYIHLYTKTTSVEFWISVLCPIECGTVISWL